MWMKYDPDATGMIQVKQLKDLVVDLTLKELYMLKSSDARHDSEGDKRHLLFDFA